MKSNKTPSSLTIKEQFELVDQLEYSLEEMFFLGEIKDVLEKLSDWKYSKDTMDLREAFGPIVDMPIFPLLLKAQAASLYCNPSLFDRIGREVTMALKMCDDDFFHQLACFAKADKGETPLADIKSKEFGWKFPRGRRAKPDNLKYVFPKALIKVISIRFLPKEKDAEFNGKKITRKELQDAVKSFNGVTISEGKLSEWLTFFEFNRFMAEQPLCKKGNEITE